VTELIIRFLVGGILVSIFSTLGDIFKPKSFAGLFGAAPSVAVATLAITALKKNPDYLAIEGRSMLLGAIGLLFYCLAVRYLLTRGRQPALRSSLLAMPLWFGVSFGLWFVLLR
jgi:uncharacterized membrane protein (GlpM family)